jgi:hypothetical protein
MLFGRGRARKSTSKEFLNGAFSKLESIGGASASSSSTGIFADNMRGLMIMMPPGQAA